MHYKPIKGARYWTKGEVDRTWKEKRESIVGAVRMVFGIIKGK